MMKSKLSLSYMARRIFWSVSHLQAYMTRIPDFEGHSLIERLSSLDVRLTHIFAILFF